ncbi:MAG: hypothetical protein R2939_00755 [Kofleriaceae bacterium]
MSSARPRPRRRSALLAGALVAAVAAVAVAALVRQRARPTAPRVVARPAVSTPLDAAVATSAPPSDAAVAASAPPPDAATVVALPPPEEPRPRRPRAPAPTPAPLPSAPPPAPPDQPEPPWSVGVPHDLQQRAIVLAEDAGTLLTASDYEGAIALYQQSLALWNHPATHFNLGFALMRLGRFTEAAFHLDRAGAYDGAGLSESDRLHRAEFLRSLRTLGIGPPARPATGPQD